jgi:D-glycero-D-manno-heptose 1,7-bisphosphate phosphatase
MAAGAGTVKAAAFLDRDGVINIDRGYVFRREDFEFVPGTLDAARELKSMGLALVVVTNQSGMARGYYGPEQFHAITDWMNETFATHGAALDGVYFCPHHPTEGEAPYRRACQCRKPAPGMLLDAARDLDIDVRRSVLFGDKASDLQAALAAGIPNRVLLGTDGRQEPDDVFPGGLATERYRSLADAVQSETMRALLARLAHEQEAA